LTMAELLGPFLVVRLILPVPSLSSL